MFDLLLSVLLCNDEIVCAMFHTIFTLSVHPAIGSNASSKLTALDLSQNLFEEQGVLDFVEGLRLCPALLSELSIERA
jgi:hypothetical protein